MNKNLINEDSLAIQCIKLINSFYKTYNISNFITKLTPGVSCDLDEFYNNFLSVSLEHLFCRIKIVENYDSNKGSLSTYVYMILKCNYIIFSYMAKYNLSYTEARRIYNMSDNDKIKALNLYAPDSYCIPICQENDEKTYDEEIINTLSDNNINNDTTNMYEQKEYLEKILEFIRTSKQITEKERKYFLYYLFTTQNYNDTAKYFGVSRQAICSTCERVRRKIRNNVKEYVY